MKTPGITRRSLAGALAAGLSAATPAVSPAAAQTTPQAKTTADEAAEALDRNAAALKAAVPDSQTEPAFRFVP